MITIYPRINLNLNIKVSNYPIKNRKKNNIKVETPKVENVKQIIKITSKL